MYSNGIVEIGAQREVSLQIKDLIKQKKYGAAKRNTQKRQANVVSLTKELDECVIGVDTTEDAVDEMLLKDSINSFLAGQTPEKRNVFIRRYFFADEIQDIVDRYGFSKSKVKMMLLRMRDDLKKHLIADGVW